MNLAGISHRILSEDAYAISKNEIIIKIKTMRNDVKKLSVYFVDKYKYLRRQAKLESKQMNIIASDELFDFYEIKLSFKYIGMQYFFKISDENETLYYGVDSFYKTKPNSTSVMYSFPTIAESDLYKNPDWARDGIVYQIFPERFNRGKNDELKEHHKAWDSKVSYDTFLGGNLRGIIEKLDYLNNLGINILYLNPIFKSKSTHKYDTDDYMEIDEEFGTKEDFRELVNKAHYLGIKVILDAVFNHTGVNFKPFQDVLINGEKSKYKDWYEFDKYDFELESQRNKIPHYRTFAYYYRMPKIMFTNEDATEYFLNVGEYWIKEFDIDGWRLDVADEVPHDFWRKFRKRLKSVKEDVLIIGEVWYDSRAWLSGDQFDSVMNYMFYNSIIGFFAEAKYSVEEFSNSLAKFRAIYKLPIYNLMLNLIDSHDTPRYLHKAKGSIDKLKLAALFQLTFTGIPHIYYGDEIGMEGGKDPDCRRGMIWDNENQNKDLFNYYKKLIEIRKSNKAFTRGEFKEVLIENDKKIYAYERTNEKSSFVIYINNSNKKQEINIKGKYKDLISEEVFNDILIVKRKSGLILQKIK